MNSKAVLLAATVLAALLSLPLSGSVTAVGVWFEKIGNNQRATGTEMGPTFGSRAICAAFCIKEPVCEGFNWNKVDNTCRMIDRQGAALDTNYEYYAKIIPS